LLLPSLCFLHSFKMRVLLLLALVALLPLLALAQVPIPYTNCGAAGDHIKVVSATANAWPPTTNSNVALSLNAVLDENVSGGSYSLQLSFDGFQIVNQQGQISALPNVTLPIHSGPIAINQNFTLPSIVGAGSSISLQASATDQNNAELLCIKIDFTVPSKSEAHVSAHQMQSVFNGHMRKAFEQMDFDMSIESRSDSELL